MLLINKFRITEEPSDLGQVKDAWQRGFKKGMKEVFALLGDSAVADFWVDEAHLVREPKRKNANRTTLFKPYYTVPNNTEHLRIATGTLKAGLSGYTLDSKVGAIRKVEINDGKMRGVFGVDVTEAETPFGTPEYDYASLHEAGGERVRPRPFLQPAVEESRDRIETILEREINKEIAKL